MSSSSTRRPMAPTTRQPSRSPPAHSPVGSARASPPSLPSSSAGAFGLDALSLSGNRSAMRASPPMVGGAIRPPPARPTPSTFSSGAHTTSATRAGGSSTLSSASTSARARNSPYNSATGYGASSSLAGKRASAAGSSSSAGSSGPSSALIAAALQSQFMSTIKVHQPGSAHSALSQAKKRAANALAQQLGLMPAPAPKLTQDEWSSVRDRARARGEHREPCPICTEDFKDSEQVLLSCSHTFHKTCLRNFEKFSGQKVCPICRSKEYEKKLINDAAVEYKEQCAVKIQSHVRRYLVRKQYLLMLATIPPKDASKRKDFFMRKLQHTSTRLEELMEKRDSAIDALFADIEKNVAQVRDSLSAAAVQLKSFSPEEWAAIRKKASLRGEEECPICCSNFEPTPASSQGAIADDLPKRRILLSCSHVYHHGCLLSFERFTIASSALEGADHTMLQRQQSHLDEFASSGGEEEVPLLQPPPACLCPLCRSNYQKAWF